MLEGTLTASTPRAEWGVKTSENSPNLSTPRGTSGSVPRVCLASENHDPRGDSSPVASSPQKVVSVAHSHEPDASATSFTGGHHGTSSGPRAVSPVLSKRGINHSGHHHQPPVAAEKQLTAVLTELAKRTTELELVKGDALSDKRTLKFLQESSKDERVARIIDQDRTILHLTNQIKTRNEEIGRCLREAEQKLKDELEKQRRDLSRVNKGLEMKIADLEGEVRILNDAVEMERGSVRRAERRYSDEIDDHQKTKLLLQYAEREVTVVRQSSQEDTKQFEHERKKLLEQIGHLRKENDELQKKVVAANVQQAHASAVTAAPGAGGTAGKKAPLSPTPNANRFQREDSTRSSSRQASIHDKTLIEQKDRELEALRKLLADLERRCAESQLEAKSSRAELQAMASMVASATAASDPTNTPSNSKPQQVSPNRLELEARIRQLEGELTCSRRQERELKEALDAEKEEHEEQLSKFQREMSQWRMLQVEQQRGRSVSVAGSPMGRRVQSPTPNVVDGSSPDFSRGSALNTTNSTAWDNDVPADVVITVLQAKVATQEKTIEQLHEELIRAKERIATLEDARRALLIDLHAARRNRNGTHDTNVVNNGVDDIEAEMLLAKSHIQRVEDEIHMMRHAASPRREPEPRAPATDASPKPKRFSWTREPSSEPFKASGITFFLTCGAVLTAAALLRERR